MTRGSAGPAASIVDVLRRHAAAEPGRPYLTWLTDGEVPSEELTFAQLMERVDAVASALVARGAQPGQRALLLYPQGPDFLVAFLACLSLGVIAVPAYPPRNARHMARIERILADAAAALILCVDENRARIEGWLSGRPTGDARMLATDTITAPAPPGWTPPALDPDGIAFLQYTSGSTGQPKGVMVTHANILANMGMIRETFGYDQDSHFISWLPAYHDMGLIGNLLTPLYHGSRVILMSPAAFLQRPLRWLQAVSTFKARTTGAPNFAFDLAARSITPEQKAALDLSSLDLLYNGSEPIDARVLARFTEAFAPGVLRGSVLYPCYGMAETTLLATGSRRGGGAGTLDVDAEALAERRGTPATADTRTRRTLVSCGWSVPGQELVIVDPDTAQALADGRVGEIWLRGPHVARGYWQQEALTAATFGARLADGHGPFLRTGDLGFVRDGELYVTGRIKDLIIVRGRNHYPHDIESTVRDAHSSLRGDGMAFSVEVDGEERLVVVQEIDRHSHADAEMVVGPIRAAIAEEHEISPHAVVIVRHSSLPKTSSGKKQRLACARAYQAGELSTVHEWRQSAERTEAAALPSIREAILEAGDSDRLSFVLNRLRSHAAEVLRIDASEVEVDRPVTAMGVDSLAAIELSHLLEKDVGVPVPLLELVQGPTLRELSRQIVESMTGVAVPVPAGESASSEDKGRSLLSAILSLKKEQQG
jgi:acyl-CoA synthetase (AMP-forming)/AMP-acid ligase II/acyl carrier protein